MIGRKRYSAAQKARAELEIRSRQVREDLEPYFDWYGLTCPCGLPPGDCKEHPRARPEQRPPGYPGSINSRSDWDVWLIQAGRNYGKTLALAQWVRHRVETGQSRLIALVNDTAKDVRDVMVEGKVSSLIAISPPWARPVYEPSKSRVVWPRPYNAIAYMYSAEAPELVRGPAFDTAWCDELPKWKNNQQRMWDNLQFTMRQTENPQIGVSTTPRPTKTYKKIISDRGTVAYTGLSTLDNVLHMPKKYIDKIQRDYAGTRLGRQEIGGELLTDTPGALWTRSMIRHVEPVKPEPDIDVPRHRVFPGMPWNVDVVRVVAAVDPAGRLQDMQRFVDGAEVMEESDGDDAGIIVACRGSDGRFYVLADLTCNGSPYVWGNVVASGYERFHVDRVVGEDNHGGRTVEEVLRRVNEHISYEPVHASRGKVPRAEPIAALYEQGRVVHLQEFSALEEEMCTYIPGMNSPNRMDALVFCLTELSENSGAIEDEDDPFGELDERF